MVVGGEGVDCWTDMGAQQPPPTHLVGQALDFGVVGLAEEVARVLHDVVEVPREEVEVAHRLLSKLLQKGHGGLVGAVERYRVHALASGLGLEQQNAVILNGTLIADLS